MKQTQDFHCQIQFMPRIIFKVLIFRTTGSKYPICGIAPNINLKPSLQMPKSNQGGDCILRTLQQNSSDGKFKKKCCKKFKKAKRCKKCPKRT